MLITPLIEAKAELTHNDDTNCPVVLSTRIRLARNLNGYSFPGWAKKSQRRAVLSVCLKAIGLLPQMKKGMKFTVDELSQLEKQILMERRLISRELMQSNHGAGVYISKDQSCAIMVNEEDHLRIQLVHGGFNLGGLWKAINDIDSQIEKHLNYAFSSTLGYLTACPTNVGTGLRCSAMMHLPALVIASQMEKVIRAVNQAGIVVRGLFGEGSDASGSIFQISNQHTLGASEEEIIKNLHKFLKVIIEHESNARHKMIETDAVKLFDKIGRAYGILKNGYLLSSAETMKLLSFLRLAVDLNILPQDYRAFIDRLFIESQPGHIQYAGKGEIEHPSKRDECRARYLREQFCDLPLLNFDNVYSKS